MEDKKNITRMRILNSATDCLLKYGYAKTGFSDIAENAGISRSLIYRYFKDKDEVFETLNDERHNSYISQSEKILQSELSQKEKLQKLIDIWIIDSYRVRVKLPYPHSWFRELKNTTQSEKRFQENFMRSLEPVIGRNLAEVVVLSFKGFLHDNPSLATLEKRANILIDLVVH